MVIKRISTLITAFLSACTTTSLPESNIEDEFGTAIIEVALETVRQDMPANSLLVGEDWFRKSIDLTASDNIKSKPSDEIIKAWWTEYPIYFSMNKTESRIDIIALDGDPQTLKMKAEYWAQEFEQRDYEDIVDYSTDIQISPKSGIVAKFRLISDYPRDTEKHGR